jgi:hypothetical protein
MSGDAMAEARSKQHVIARRLWRAWAYLYIALSIVSMAFYAQTAFLAPP